MCFTAIISSPSSIGHEGLSVLMQMVEEHHSWNNDGYALRATDYSGKELLLRTLDFGEFSDFIETNSAAIEGSTLVHLHLRNATSRVCEEFVHLWEIGGWYCSHNGTLPDFAKDHDHCDSLEFFRSLSGSIASEDWDAVAESLRSTGRGVFLMSKKSEPKAVVASINKEARVSKKGGALAFSSDRWTGFTPLALQDGLWCTLGRKSISDRLVVLDLRGQEVEYSASLSRSD